MVQSVIKNKTLDNDRNKDICVIFHNPMVCLRTRAKKYLSHTYCEVLFHSILSSELSERVAHRFLCSTIYICVI